MIDAWIAPILIFSGIVTAGGGAGALFFPRTLLRLVFGLPDVQQPMMFFIRHWGALLACIGLLIASSAYVPAARQPLLELATFEKLLAVGLVFFGPIKRTPLMTAVAAADGIFALLYIAFVLNL